MRRPMVNIPCLAPTAAEDASTPAAYKPAAIKNNGANPLIRIDNTPRRGNPNVIAAGINVAIDNDLRCFRASRNLPTPYRFS